MRLFRLVSMTPGHVEIKRTRRLPRNFRPLLPPLQFEAQLRHAARLDRIGCLGSLALKGFVPSPPPFTQLKQADSIQMSQLLV
jgi:hypothetical protein